MKKYLAILIFIPVFFSCAGGPSKQEAVVVPEGRHFFDTSPYNNELVFLGVAGLRYNKDESIKFALEDAARKVAFYQSVSGAVVHSLAIGEGFFDFSSESESSIDFDKDYVKYVDELQYDPETDVFIDNQTVFVRARYTPQGFHRIDHVFTSREKQPQWINNPPKEINGFCAGVGYAARRRDHKDTIIASYENAVYDIIRNVSSSVNASTKSRQTSQRSLGSSGNSNSSVLSASGRLQGFYVLEIWIDPDNRTVWTLAIAQETF